MITNQIRQLFQVRMSQDTVDGIEDVIDEIQLENLEEIVRDADLQYS